MSPEDGELVVGSVESVPADRVMAATRPRLRSVGLVGRLVLVEDFRVISVDPRTGMRQSSAQAPMWLNTAYVIKLAADAMHEDKTLLTAFDSPTIQLNAPLEAVLAWLGGDDDAWPRGELVSLPEGAG